ncbi:hypothetical protein PMAYCL1PPCAC_10504, partial [Pristionchus mayeri]
SFPIGILTHNDHRLSSAQLGPDGLAKHVDLLLGNLCDWLHPRLVLAIERGVEEATRCLLHHLLHGSSSNRAVHDHGPVRQPTRLPYLHLVPEGIDAGCRIVGHDSVRVLLTDEDELVLPGRIADVDQSTVRLVGRDAA